MRFTDIFIRRPVLAIVVSLLILTLGLRAVFSLQVRQYPHTENATITIVTTYYGADPDLVAGFITTPLENAVAQANGIDYLTSQSVSGSSTITAYLRLNQDADASLTEISAKVSSVLNQLPSGTQQPVLSISVGQTFPDIIIGFKSEILPANQVTDYLIRVVQPKFQALPGVQTAEIIGGQNIALRVWLDPAKLAAYGLTAADVDQALLANDTLSGIGNTKGQMIQVNLTASTSLHSAEEFKQLVVKQNGATLVRLRDLGEVTLGSETYDSQVSMDGRKAMFIGIRSTPAANVLDVADGVHKIFPGIVEALPEGISAQIMLDSSSFVKSAIGEVERTLIVALLIVTAVIFAFLGSLRSVLIATVAIPLSIIGTFAMMLVLGFSINLLTLLALVLSIGLVVDDAIIVVENVSRHIEAGMTPVQAALRAGRELGSPIIAMTVVLAAVYVPVGFQGGLTGALFSEFALTLVGAVTVSATVALTLSPMMCARLFEPHHAGARGWQDRLIAFIDRVFDYLKQVYLGSLRRNLDYLPLTVAFSAVVLVSIYFLFSLSSRTLAPTEDQGFLGILATPAPAATLNQKLLYSQQVMDQLAKYPEIHSLGSVDTPGQDYNFAAFKPWNERSRSTMSVAAVLQKGLDGVAGEQYAVFSPPSLPGSAGFPIQFVIKTTEPFDRLNEVTQQLLEEVQKSGMFIFVQSDLRVDRPQATLEIDHDKAAALGISMTDIGSAMAGMLGGGYVNYFSMQGRSYRVIPQVFQTGRLNPDQLLDYYVHTPSGQSIPLSTVAAIRDQTVPESLNRFQQLNAATIQGVPFPGVSVGDVLVYLNDLAARTLPQGYAVDYGGEARQYVQESGGFSTTIAFAALIVLLALAALFESFRDPVIILFSVPMSIAGALVFICMGVFGMTLNIYTEVGLVTLMGLISKHGILIVEFANDLQRQGMTRRQAIEEAAAIRLRPILMTTAAMVLGVVPLLTASGAGAVSRFQMGMVIATGLTAGTMFTLLIVPSMYLLLAAQHAPEPGLPEPQPAG
jgi:multidrug efflux pump